MPKAHGVANGRCKLTDAQVRAIRKRYAKGNITKLHLATRYGVSRSLVSLIVRNKRREKYVDKV